MEAMLQHISWGFVAYIGVVGGAILTALHFQILESDEWHWRTYDARRLGGDPGSRGEHYRACLRKLLTTPAYLKYAALWVYLCTSGGFLVQTPAMTLLHK